MPNRSENPRYRLTLFVTPESSGKALQNLYIALSELAYTDYELRMVDVVQEPELARKYKIIEPPALVYHKREGPIVIEHMGEAEAIRKMLGIADNPRRGGGRI